MRVVIDCDGTLIGRFSFEGKLILKIVSLFAKTRVGKKLYLSRKPNTIGFKILNEFRERGAEVFIFSGFWMPELIEIWLKNHGIVYEKLIANINKEPQIFFKLRELAKLNPDIVVDNNLKIIEQWNLVSRGKIEKIGNIFVWIREELQIGKVRMRVLNSPIASPFAPLLYRSRFLLMETEDEFWPTVDTENNPLFYFILAPFGVLSFDVKEKSALFLIEPRKNPFEVGKKLIRIFGGL